MSESVKARATRGRPRDSGKREALLDAARELFLKHGYDVSTDAVAARAKVAKATLYANFSDKEALLEAVLRRESDRTVTDEQFSASLELDLDAALVEFGIRYLRFVNDRQLSGWDRLLISAVENHPKMPQRFFAAGPGRGRNVLAEILAAGVKRDELAADDTTEAAGDLIGLWMGFTSLEVNLGARKPLKPAEIRSRVVRGVKLFMRIYRTHHNDA